MRALPGDAQPPGLESNDVACRESKLTTTRVALIGSLFLGLLVGGSGWLEAAGAVDEALEVAEAWLKLVDRGEYDRSWQEAAAYFRKVVERDQWNKTLTGVRQPLGEVESRELLEAKYRSSLAGAPDGEYVVIRFRTSFANKADSQETITPMLDPDGRWRVSGYYIK
jgi:hypothetical protein